MKVTRCQVTRNRENMAEAASRLFRARGVEAFGSGEVAGQGDALSGEILAATRHAPGPSA